MAGTLPDRGRSLHFSPRTRGDPEIHNAVILERRHGARCSTHDRSYSATPLLDVFVGHFRILNVIKRVYPCIAPGRIGVWAMILLAGGCGRLPSENPRLTVFAAASLTEAFTVLADSFEAAHPGVDVALNFAGSQQLAGQLRLGAPADVFASANEQQMQVAIEAGRIAADAPRPFAWNRLVIVTPAANPAGIGALADLDRPGVKLVLAAAEVPAGRYARDVFQHASRADILGDGFSAQVEANIVSNEPHVRAVLTKVALGEADAGVVYASDAASPDGAATRVLPIPDSLNTIAAYPIAAVADSEVPALAQAFIALIRSPAGVRVLTERGFGSEPVRP